VGRGSHGEGRGLRPGEQQDGRIFAWAIPRRVVGLGASLSWCSRLLQPSRDIPRPVFYGSRNRLTKEYKNNRRMKESKCV
jgi:hypothetical protein